MPIGLARGVSGALEPRDEEQRGERLPSHGRNYRPIPPPTLLFASVGLARAASACFPSPTMLARARSNPLAPKLALCTALLLIGGCYAGYFTYSAAGGGSEYAVGEEHVSNFPASQTFVMIQDVLRGDGVLFNVKPEKRVVSEWRAADVPVGVFSNLVGVSPRYRYEIQVLPLSSHQSKIIANVRAEDIPEQDIDQFKPNVKLHLFKQFDEYARKFPPPPSTPSSGGVNFALLPGENLIQLAKRVTGNADNWRQIAKDNNLNSPTDLAGVQSVWVRNSLLPGGGNSTAPASSP